MKKIKKTKERLTDNQWKDIELKNSEGLSMRRLAREYNVAFMTIWRYFQKKKDKSSWKFWKKP